MCFKEEKNRCEIWRMMMTKICVRSRTGIKYLATGAYFEIHFFKSDETETSSSSKEPYTHLLLTHDKTTQELASLGSSLLMGRNQTNPASGNTHYLGKFFDVTHKMTGPKHEPLHSMTATFFHASIVTDFLPPTVLIPSTIIIKVSTNLRNK